MSSLSLERYAKHFSQRPEVISRGRPTAHVAIQRVLAEAKERVRTGETCVACPAARLVAIESERGIIVRCGIEHSHVTSKLDPSTLVNRCFDDPGYQGCTSWRADKERIWEGRRPLVGDREGV